MGVDLCATLSAAKCTFHPPDRGRGRGRVPKQRVQQPYAQACQSSNLHSRLPISYTYPACSHAHLPSSRQGQRKGQGAQAAHAQAAAALCSRNPFCQSKSKSESWRDSLMMYECACSQAHVPPSRQGTGKGQGTQAARAQAAAALCSRSSSCKCKKSPGQTDPDVLSVIAAKRTFHPPGRGRGRGRAPKQRVPKQQQPYAEERGGAYRPMGAALTIQEVWQPML